MKTKEQRIKENKELRKLIKDMTKHLIKSKKFYADVEKLMKRMIKIFQ